MDYALCDDLQSAHSQKQNKTKKTNNNNNLQMVSTWKF